MTIDCRHRGTRMRCATRRQASVHRLVAMAIYVALAMLSAPRDAAAQMVNFKNYSSAEGLPQTQVMAIKQDKLGYLWFATYGGLSRFNGGEFRTYEKQDGLSSNSVFDIAQDRAGRMLIATSGGLCIMERGNFTCYRQADGLINDNVRSVAVDSLGGAWAGTSSGLSYVRDGKIRNYTTAQGVPGQRVIRVVVDSGGRVWAATDKGLARLEGERFVLDSPDVIGSTRIQFIAQARDGLLVGTMGRLYLRRGDTLTPIAEGALPDSMRFTDGAIDRDGTIWVATRTGVLRIKDGRVDRLGRANGMLSEQVNRVTIDREGDVWFGTESGASKHVPGPFRTYTEGEGLPAAFVRAIGVDEKGRLWMGGSNGVAVREGERFRPIPLPGVPDNRVFSFSRMPGGGMLIGTHGGMISYVDGKVTWYDRKDGLPGDMVYCLTDDGAGGIWIGTEHGLARWFNGKITAIDRPDLTKLSIISMHRDRRGRLWMGRMEGGMAILDGDSVSFMAAAEGASDQTVWAISEDAKGRIWAGTNGDGAVRIDTEGIRHFTVKDGLASNFIWQVHADSRGDIWLFGNVGLDRYSGERLTHYGRGNGLYELEGSAGASHEDTEGSLWFGTGSGVVRFTPGLDGAPKLAPPIFIEEATEDGRIVPLVAAEGGTKLSRGVLRIRYASPSFRDESVIRFRYRLMGLGADWSTASSDRSITYAGLRPGAYQFEVVAVNAGVHSDIPARIAFEVTPAFWQTWWFRSLGIVLLLGAAAVVPSLRARALEQERRRLEALVAQHTRDLAEKNARLEGSNRDLEQFAYIASHDLQEPLRKIQAFSDRVAKQYGERMDDQGRDYLARMGGAAARMQRLIDALLSLSRITTKTHPIESIELPELLQEVIGDLEVRIQSTQGRVELGILPSIEGDPVQIRQLFQNLIGNALKFHKPGEAPVVRVTAVTRGSGTIEIRVEDNGIGFENKDAERVFLPFQRLHGRMEYEGTGIGLTICQKIVERHGGTIRGESTPGKGSRFVLTLPIHGPVREKQHAA
jgi:signal transduction histidine kinase/ligand-binding sensor domain-containing protein